VTCGGAVAGGLGPRERSRIAANVCGLRARARVSREELAFLAMMATDRLARIEADAQPDTGLDVWVRLAGSLDVSLVELLAGVAWKPAEQE
jgi:transcriptional regulator with XRE-family HTH domain